MGVLLPLNILLPIRVPLEFGDSSRLCSTFTFQFLALFFFYVAQGSTLGSLRRNLLRHSRESKVERSTLLPVRRGPYLSSVAFYD